MAKVAKKAKKNLIPENLLGSILDAAPVGVVVIDQEGTIVRFTLGDEGGNTGARARNGRPSYSVSAGQFRRLSGCTRRSG